MNSDNYTDFTDEELIKKYRNGEFEISDYLIEKYRGMVKTKARALYLVGGETDDLVQEGMIGLFKAVRDYDVEKGSSFKTFANLCIDRQMYNVIQSYARNKHIPLNTYVSLSDDEQNLSNIGTWNEDPETIMINREALMILKDRIAGSLSPLEKQVLELYLSGESYQSIADRLHKPVKSIDNALRRIRSKIKNGI